MKLNQLIISKTYLSKTLQEGFYRVLENGLEFIITHDELIELFLKAIKDVYREQTAYPNEVPEIAQVLNSPSFRILLERSCVGLDHEVEGYYDQVNNIICFNLGQIFQSYASSAKYYYRLKEVIRHEMHHAHKNIMRALFPLRPEVFIPCSYHVDSDWSIDDLGPKAIRKNFQELTYQYSEFSHPIYPFNSGESRYFIDSLRADTEVLTSSLLTCPPTSQNQSTVHDLISRYYHPSTWRKYICGFVQTYGNKTVGAIITKTQNRASFCLDIFHPGLFREGPMLPLCVRDLILYNNDCAHVAGHTVRYPYQEKPEALVHDVQWRIQSVFRNYPWYQHFYDRTWIEVDAWLFEFPYALFRTLFARLNTIRIQEALKVANRNTTTVSYKLCKNTVDLKQLQTCLKEICTNGFSFHVGYFLQNHVYNKMSLATHYNCNPDKISCIADHMQNSLIIDIKHPKFLETIDALSVDKKILNKKLGHSEYESLDSYFQGVRLIISPWYSILAAALVAFREELLINPCNKLFSKISSSDKKEVQERQKNIEHSSDNRTAFSIVSACSEMAVRNVVPTDVMVVHDMVRHVKLHIKEHCKQKGHSITEICKATVNGCLTSIAGIAWRYLVGPVITGAIAVKDEVRKGYQQNGVLGAIDRGLETYADHFIPGAHAVLERQKTLLLRYQALQPSPLIVEQSSSGSGVKLKDHQKR